MVGIHEHALARLEITNDINVYYPADKAVLTSKAGTITNSAEKVEYTTLLTAPQAGIDEKKAMAARGADEICRLKTDRNNYVLSHTKRTRFTVNSNSVGKIDLLSKAPNPYGTGDPIKTVDWYPRISARSQEFPKL